MTISERAHAKAAFQRAATARNQRSGIEHDRAWAICFVVGALSGRIAVTATKDNERVFWMALDGERWSIVSALDVYGELIIASNSLSSIPPLRPNNAELIEVFCETAAHLFDPRFQTRTHSALFELLRVDETELATSADRRASLRVVRGGVR